MFILDASTTLASLALPKTTASSLRPTKWLKTTLRKGLLTYGRSRLHPKGADPNATVLRSASTPPKVATGNSHCELLGEACNNGVLASSACPGLMTSALGSKYVLEKIYLILGWIPQAQRHLRCLNLTSRRDVEASNPRIEVKVH